MGCFDTWPDESARAASLAAFHAAQALIFEQTNKAPKTHHGVHRQFARLTRQASTLDAELHGFLGRAYNMKAAADYGTDPGMQINRDRAAAAAETAKRFVSAVTGMLPQS
ncbi:MAG TPA: HEPN domain-containing protein [Acetobacteraceae bacterium]|nr:HEPN domain-containing protein [Acetobacteraceae bacterium]